MKTLQTYYAEPYVTELDCTVVSVEQKGPQQTIELDRTIFYPEGGGQPSDQGEMMGPSGKFRVEQVRTTPDGRIVHQGKLPGTLNIGESVHTTIKWGMRFKNMRVHSAGHLIHDVLMTMVDGLTPIKGNHGAKAFLEYAGALDRDIQAELEANANEVVAQNVPIITRETTVEEISEKCRFVPAGLPKNKQLRMIQIGDFAPMPDGGVQVKSTGEIGRVVIHSITADGKTVVIRYGVKGSE
jgi:alanyl-tRNA synthetase